MKAVSAVLAAFVVFGFAVSVKAASPGDRGAGLLLPHRDATIRAFGAASALESTLGPMESLAVTMSDMNAFQLRSITGADGGSVIIAIIDTGVDVSHPDLRITSRGQPKVVDWVDFTGEGDVDTRLIAKDDGTGSIVTPLGRLKLGAVRSISGRYHYGAFPEYQVDSDGPLGNDLNNNGVGGESFLVVAVDSVKAGVYDVVYVDTNLNLDLSDEVPLKEFRVSGLFGKFGDEGLSFVVSRLDPSGDRVNLGFDANGHGTHVAGIASGFAPGGVGVSGIAPAARVIALKALTASGGGSWYDILRAAVYAGELGAKVISISAGGVDDISGYDTPESQILDKVAQEYGSIVIVAAGNTGPGVGTGRTPGSVNTLTVGAYISPDMWEALYGLDIKYSTLWHFSAVGPRPNGEAFVSVLAPGAAVSSVPKAIFGTDYYFFEGTSMAVPHAAGGAALLLDAMWRWGLNPDGSQVVAALKTSAVPIPGLSAVEQGWGAIDLVRAWRAARQGRKERLPASLFVNEESKSVYNRGLAPAYSEVNLGWWGSQDATLKLRSAESWMRPDKEIVWVNPGSARQIRLSYFPEDEGLYSGFLQVMDASGREGEAFPVTLVVPKDVSQQTAAVGSGFLLAGQSRRHFLNVLDGTKRLSLYLKVKSDESGLPAGKVMMHVFKPNGQEAFSSDYVGLPTKEQLQVNWHVDDPDPGVWEVVVYSSPLIARYGLRGSEYELDASAVSVKPGFVKPSLGSVQLGKTSRVIVSVIPSGLQKTRARFKLTIRDAETNRPVNTKVVVNGTEFVTVKGEVEFLMRPSNGQNLTVKLPELGEDAWCFTLSTPVRSLPMGSLPEAQEVQIRLGSQAGLSNSASDSAAGTERSS